MSPLVMKTCEMFAKKGIAVELWIPWRQSPGFSHVDPFDYHGIERNFTIRRIPALDLTATLPGNFFFFLMLTTFQLSLLFCLRKPDLFYFHDVRDTAIPSFSRKPMFLEIHDFYKSGAGWINRRLFPQITGFVVTNRFKMEALKKEFGIPEKKMFHQPNAVDVKMFGVDISKGEARTKLSLVQNQKIILYTGHLFYWKGVDTLLETAQFLNKDEIVYFVGGTDKDIEDFKFKSVKFKNVAVVGRKPHKEIPLWLRAADVLALPSPAKYPESKYETSPVKLFEYMASGTPIVASDVPSIRNIIDEKAAFFFEPDNPKSLAEILTSVLASPEESIRRARSAREEAGRYSWERRAESIIAFVDKEN